MNLRLWLLLAVVVEISDCKKRKKKKKNKSCLLTSIPVCKKLEFMPKFPCARHEKREEWDEPKGHLNAKETVCFLNKEKKYDAARRQDGKAHVCCSPKSLWKELKVFKKTSLFKESEETLDICKTLLAENQADKATKYKKLKSKKNKNKFIRMCMWLQLSENPRASNELMMASKSMACSAHLVEHVKPSYGVEADKPICFFLMYHNMKHLLNSEHAARCGAEFRTRVNQLAQSGASSKLTKELKLADATDSKKCMWTKIGLCTEAYPTAPCHKPPVKWPRKYNKVKQEKTLAVHFLNEKPDYIEKNINGHACCSRKEYYKMLKRLYKAAKVQESAEPCLALATEHQANAEMKVRKFDTKMFTSFCVLARQMYANKEEVQAGLLRGTHDRTCIMRAVTTDTYNPRSIPGIYCEYVRLTNLEHFLEKLKPRAKELCTGGF